jgi:hypothetical protein
MLSVRDIQGSWREEKTKNVWTVNGIVAERPKVPRQGNKPIVLSDGAAGVEWGNGNLKGSLEDGYLCWRNRRGEITYRWTKLDANAKDLQIKEATKVARKPPVTLPPQPPTKTKAENQSPRSTNSGQSAETAEMLASMGSGMQMIPGSSGGDSPTDSIAVGEMQMLLEMASQRLLAGDVYMSMRYITLAQQVQPLNASLSHGK